MSRIALAIASLAAAVHANGMTLPAIQKAIAAARQVLPAATISEEREAGISAERVPSLQGASLGSPAAMATGFAPLLICPVRISAGLVRTSDPIPAIRERHDARLVRLSSVWLRAGPSQA